jgi:CheY-like chemotaxis protein
MPSILVVDDELPIRMLIEQCLEDLREKGVRILFADNGIDALEIIKKERPELVFLDIMMPKMDGYKVSNIVKNELGMKDVYIVMLTAKGQEVEKHKGTEAGADFYITKPFSIFEITNKALEVLGINSE